MALRGATPKYQPSTMPSRAALSLSARPVLRSHNLWDYFLLPA